MALTDLRQHQLPQAHSFDIQVQQEMKTDQQSTWSISLIHRFQHRKTFPVHMAHSANSQ
jgi:hypothetical protein